MKEEARIAICTGTRVVVTVTLHFITDSVEHVHKPAGKRAMPLEKYCPLDTFNKLLIAYWTCRLSQKLSFGKGHTGL